MWKTRYKEIQLFAMLLQHHNFVLTIKVILQHYIKNEIIFNDDDNDDDDDDDDDDDELFLWYG